MAKDQTECSKLKLRLVIKFLMAKRWKACEIHRRACDVYGETCFSENNVYKWAKHRFST